MGIKQLPGSNNIVEGDNVNYNPESIIFQDNANNNILVLESNLKLENSEIKFRGSNSIVFLRSNINTYKLRVEIFNNSAFYMGINNYINGTMQISLSEGKHIFFGNNGTFSFGIWVRNSDLHLIYLIKTMKRKNYSKSIFVGDHVWLGQHSTLLKGTQIASGSIIGANSLISNKKINSNTIWAGNPAKRIAKGVFWDGMCVNNWTDEQTEKFSSTEKDQFIFKYDVNEYLSFDEIDKQLTMCKTANHKMDYLVNISNIVSKNRFAF